jgi:MATE family multidrug resistance protein
MPEENQHFRDELRPMLRLAAPLVLAELSWMGMAFVDTIMVGRLPNSAVAIGAVSLASVTFYAIAILGSGILLGLDTLVSQAFGAGQIEECHAALLDGTYISLALTPLLMGLLEFGCVPLWRTIGIDPTILRESIPYLNTLNWSLLPLFVYFGARRYLQGMNLVKPVVFAMVSANLVNLLGNWMFIYGHLGAPRLGIVGSGWSTCVSRIYMAVVLLGYIAYHDRRYKTGLRHIRIRPHFQRIQELLRLGLPAGVQMTLEVGVFAAATALVAKLDPVSLAAHQIALNMASITYMVPLGISSAAAVRVGQAIGRKDARGASHAGWSAIAIGSVFMTCAALAFLLVPRLIARIYTPDQAVIRMAVSLLAVAAVFQLFDGLQVVATGALRGTGETHIPMITNLVSYWFLGLPAGAYLCFRMHRGAVGMWAGLCIGLVLIGSILLWVWSRKVQEIAKLIPRN